MRDRLIMLATIQLAVTACGRSEASEAALSQCLRQGDTWLDSGAPHFTGRCVAATKDKGKQR